MSSIARVILVTRLLNSVLDKYFDAKGKNMREKVASAEGELGPDLTRDLTKIANTEERAKRTSKVDATIKEFDATVARAFRGLRSKKPEVAADVSLPAEAPTVEAPAVVITPAAAPEPAPVAKPKPAESEGSWGWTILALVLVFFAIIMSGGPD
ncbi:MAG: hypothetical protein ABW321_35930 [Polyangiales bacterium]